MPISDLPMIESVRIDFSVDLDELVLAERQLFVLSIRIRGHVMIVVKQCNEPKNVSSFSDDIISWTLYLKIEKESEGVSEYFNGP